MIRKLHLQKPLLCVFFGIVLYVGDKIFNDNNLILSNFLLGFSGVLMIVGAALFLYPIIFAKKVDPEGKKVELTPLSEEKER